MSPNVSLIDYYYYYYYVFMRIDFNFELIIQLFWIRMSCCNIDHCNCDGQTCECNLAYRICNFINRELVRSVIHDH